MVLDIEELRNRYYDAILLLQDEQDIIDSLPNPQYQSFFPIIQGLIDLIDRDIVEWKSMDDIDEQVSLEIALLEKKKYICLELKEKALEEEKFVDEVESSNHRNLVFALSPGGRVYIENDIKSISCEFYDRIIDCLRMIETGSYEVIPSKAKILGSNSKISGIHEVKLFQVRVFYEILPYNSVYVHMVRIKKDDNSLSDRRDPIIRRGNIGKDYDCVKKFLKESSLEERELFLLSQKQIYDDIVSNLKANSRGEKNV